MMVNVANVENLLFCPSECDNYNETLLLFQRVRPPNCPFMPTRIWASHTRKKKTCIWCVLYETIDPQIPYANGDQGKELRNELNKWKPIRAEIVDYEFHTDNCVRGWLFRWRNMTCTHSANFRKQDKTRKGRHTARAVTGEAGVPFFHAAGSEFDEYLVGQGARRVPDLFKPVKEEAPSAEADLPCVGP